MSIIKGQMEIETGDVLYPKTSFDNIEGAPDWAAPNLLLNSDFKRGIVNQKGKTTYDPVAKWTLSIDGWLYFGQMQVILQDGNIKLYSNSSNTGSSYIKQPIKNLDNGEHLLYIHVVSLSGTAHATVKSGVDTPLKVGDNFIKANVETNSLQVQINLNGKGINLVIDQMKLEKGSHFTGMPTWNYEDELLKCYRNYISFKGQSIFKSIYVGQNYAVVTYDLPFPVLKHPSAVILGGAKMAWQNHDSSLPNDTLITSAQVTGVQGNSLTVQFFGAFGNSTWKSAYMHGLGVDFDWNEY